jgi:hypothetical protein
MQPGTNQPTYQHTKLDLCDLHDSLFANGLRGNSRLKSLRPRRYNRNVFAIAGAALKENTKALFTWMRDETLDAVCDYFKTHPKLEDLDFRSVFTEDTVAPAMLKSQIQALFDMVQRKTSIHTILWDSRYSEQKILQGKVIPHLATNAFRATVLRRALLVACTDANSFG